MPPHPAASCRRPTSIPLEAVAVPLHAALRGSSPKLVLLHAVALPELPQRQSGQFTADKSARRLRAGTVGHTEFQVVCSANGPLGRAYHWTSPVSVIVRSRSSATAPLTLPDLDALSALWVGQADSPPAVRRDPPPAPSSRAETPASSARVTPACASRLKSYCAQVTRRSLPAAAQPRRNSRLRTACEPGLLGGLSSLRVGRTGI